MLKRRYDYRCYMGSYCFAIVNVRSVNWYYYYCANKYYFNDTKEKGRRVPNIVAVTRLSLIKIIFFILIDDTIRVKRTLHVYIRTLDGTGVCGVFAQ